MKKCVYTQIIGNYDNLKNPKIITPGWDYICFTDTPSSFSSDIWQIKQVENKENLSAQRLSRKIWTLFHHYVNDYDLSVMIGGQLEIRCNLDELLKRYLPEDDSIDMSILKHPNRNCIYQEANKCISKNLDDINVIKKQIERYRKEGYPENNGLVACGVMIRKHHRKNLEKHFDMIWEEITNNSFRDQLSFNYILWKYNLIKIHLFPYDIIHGSEFKRMNHRNLKR